MVSFRNPLNRRVELSKLLTENQRKFPKNGERSGSGVRNNGREEATWRKNVDV